MIRRRLSINATWILIAIAAVTPPAILYLIWGI